MINPIAITRGFSNKRKKQYIKLTFVFDNPYNPVTTLGEAQTGLFIVPIDPANQELNLTTLQAETLESYDFRFIFETILIGIQTAPPSAGFNYPAEPLVMNPNGSQFNTGSIPFSSSIVNREIYSIPGNVTNNFLIPPTIQLPCRLYAGNILSDQILPDQFLLFPGFKADFIGYQKTDENSR